MHNALLAFLFLVSTSLFAAPHHKERLAEFAKSVKKGEVVVFDLDDTLMDLRYRGMGFYTEMAKDADLQKKFPKETQMLIDGLNLDVVGYTPEITLAGVGLLKSEYSAFFSEADSYFRSHAFKSNALAWDKPVDGAVDFVNDLFNKGAVIVYLSGRSANVQEASEKSLKKLGFPMGGANTAIFLKPEGSKGNTSDFKGRVGAEIQKLGTVAGVFDNEPANLVEIRKVWGAKSAKLFFVNTQWAGYKMEEMVHAGNVFWLRNFETL
jgi:hypothetical protein